MRQVYVLRGLPGCGKSTFIREAGLAPYTIAPDDIRLLMGSPVINEAGRLVMPSKDDALVWKLLREAVERRMARGELLVIDATHTLPNYFHDYARLAGRYRYKCYAVDFAGVPLKVCKERNAAREPYKVVDEPVLDKMHERLRKFPIPKQFEVLTPEQVAATLENDVADLSSYKRVHHIGDIQGCYTPLKEYFDTHPFSEDEYYIFIGDLLDRGTENAEVLQYICANFVDRPNVVFIEGNHEQHLWNWLTKQPVSSREFNGRTRGQLERAEIDKGAVSRLFRNMRQCLCYTYRDRMVLVSHGGLSAMPDKLKLIPADQYIRGAGAYEQVGAIDDAFARNSPSEHYQVHGHRNRQDYPLVYNERCFNLEGKIEFGGDLRALQLGNKGFVPIELRNTSSELTMHPENAAFIHALRTNRHIAERQLPGSISSFHFKTEVIFKKAWTEQNVKARGLFVNTLTNEIVIRAYDKFFNINERRDTELPALKQKLRFPLKAWVKENGYLGLLGYDAVSGDLVFASKSTTEGEFAAWFKELFLRLHGDKTDRIKQYLQDNNACLVFEVILPGHDPHIIRYEQDKLVLLDIVKRQAEFERLSDRRRESFAQETAMETKRLAKKFSSWRGFETWLKSLKGLDYVLDGEPVEGFVIEDANHYHVKVKLDGYSFWKQLRSALDCLKNGKQPSIKQECEYPELAARVIEFMRGLPASELSAADIIAIREKFLAAG